MGFFKQKMINEMTIRGFSLNTQRSYLLPVRMLVIFANKSPEHITLDDIYYFQLYLKNERKVSWNTFNLYIKGIRFFFLKVLKRRWDIEFIPYTKRGLLLPVVLSKHEIIQLYTNASNIKHKSIIALIYSTGLRVSESATLKIADIDSKRMMIKVNMGKGNKDRFVMLSNKLLKLLRNYWKVYKPASWLFEGQNHTSHISVRTIQHIFRYTKSKASIKKKVTPHVLRHSFATHLLESGVDIKKIQVLLGHRSLRATILYLHVAKDFITKIESPLDSLKLDI